MKRTVAVTIAVSLMVGVIAQGAKADNRLEVEGRATVVDANHLRIEGELVRLFGMEAPSDEWCDGCGAKAEEVLKAFVDGKNVHCRKLQARRETVMVGDAALAACQVRAQHQDKVFFMRFTERSPSWHLAKEGWAYPFAWVDFFGTIGRHIVNDGEKARKRKRGMWRHDVQIPDDAYARTGNWAWIPSSGGTVAGEARALTGDTLEVDGTAVHCRPLNVLSSFFVQIASPSSGASSRERSRKTDLTARLRDKRNRAGRAAGRTVGRAGVDKHEGEPSRAHARRGTCQRH